MTVQSLVNQYFVGGADTMYYLKETLKLAGWTVPASSDGTLKYTSDVWSSTSAAQVNYAWIALVTPDGERTLVFQRGSANYYWMVSYLKGALDLTTGDGTTPPDASVGTFQYLLGGSGSWSQMFDGDGAANITNIVVMDSSTDARGGFWVSVFSGTAPRLEFIFDPLDNTRATDPDPCVVRLAPVFTGLGPWEPGYYGRSSYGAQGYLGTSWVRFAATALTDLAGNAVYNNGQGPNSLTGKIDTYPFVYLRNTSDGGAQGYKGVSSMCSYNGYGAGTARGNTLNITGAKSHVAAALYSYNRLVWVMPWNGVDEYTV